MSIPLNRQCDHEENRFKVCAPCGRKIVLGTQKIGYFKISDKFEQLIKKLINENFDLLNPNYPVSICTTCRHTLVEFEKGSHKRPLPKMPKYEVIHLPRNTRIVNKLSGGKVCNCYICVIGCTKSHKKQKKGRGVCRNFDTHTTEATGMHGASTKIAGPEKNAAVRKKPDLEENRLVLCRICFQEIGKGKRHSCITRQDRSTNVISKNLSSTIQTLPDNQQDRIVGSILQNKIKASTDNLQRKNIELKLTTPGTPCRILVHPEDKPYPFFSSERLDNLQVKTGASSRQIAKITNFIRCIAGRKSVSSHHSKHVTENSKSLLNLYHQKEMEFDVENSVAKEKRPVIWADAEALIESVIEKRELVGYYLIKVMADGGQGFFKVSLTILPANDNLTYDCSHYEQDVPGKRTKYAEGGIVGKNANLNSVHKLIMLCAVPKIKETYENLKLIFHLTQLNNITFKFVADFKLLLIVNGQQTATSSYPCPYCFVTLNNLKDGDLDQENMDPCAQNLKTYGQLETDFSRFCADGKQKKMARYSRSTVNSPLFRESDELTVLEKCVPPELHLLQGFVNHLFWSGLVPVLGREKALLWPKKLNVISKGYHGEIFEGNACRRLLKEADRLNDAEIYQDCGYFRIVPFISAFKAMNELVKKCFCVEREECDIDKLVEDLKKAVQATGVSVTLKLHVILTHMRETLGFIGSHNGLGLWSEQAGESVHHEFLKYWQRYKVNSIENPSYAEKLRTTVAEFSSTHI